MKGVVGSTGTLTGGGHQYELRDGDIVNVDVSCFFKGHHADLNETYLVGNVDDVGKKLVRVTYECLWKAIAECKPGVYYRDMGNVISKVAAAACVCVCVCSFFFASMPRRTGSTSCAPIVGTEWASCFTATRLYPITPRTKPWA